jgi:hypothetical protein
MVSLSKYWGDMTPEQRSAEMSKRRTKSKKPAGGFTYMSKERQKEISSLGGKNRWVKKDASKEV